METVRAARRRPLPLRASRPCTTAWAFAQRMLDVGQRVIRPSCPTQHREFFAQLPFVLVGSVDAAGRPWASVLVGEPGFMQAPDADAAATSRRGRSPATRWRKACEPGAPLGFLGIELHTRRRNRMNGHVLAMADAQGFRCASSRPWATARSTSRAASPNGCATPSDQRRAARSRPLTAGRRGAPLRAPGRHPVRRHPRAGAEGEHRRAAPTCRTAAAAAGFVRVEDERSFLVPDFTGNFFFMTLGNLQLDPRAGVLFIDFATGDLLTADRHAPKWCGTARS